MKKTIKEVAFDYLNVDNPLVDYADGDVVIIDDVHGLQEFSPIKSGFNSILLCTGGCIQLDVNSKRMLLCRNDVLITPPHVLLDNYLVSPDFSCKVVCLSEQVIPSVLSNYMRIWNDAVYINDIQMVHLPDVSVELFGYYHSLIRLKIKDAEGQAKRDIMHSILRALLLELCCVLKNSNDLELPVKVSQGKLLVDRFLKQIAASKVKRKPVGQYAYELNVTPKYLSMMCIEHSGKSALEWIRQFVNEDIRYYLKNTQVPVKELVNTLGFCTMSHFGTYCRRSFGVSPTILRHQLQEQ